MKEGQIDGAISLPLGRLIREARQGDLDEIKRKKILYLLFTWIQRKYHCPDELNKQGFNAITIEGGYSAWKKHEKEK